MKTKNTYEVVKYFELDERVNFSNYKEVAVKVNYNSELINILFEDFKDYIPNLVQEFEPNSYSGITADEDEYYNHLWVEAELFNFVENNVSHLSISSDSGTICLFLLMLKHCEKFFTQSVNPEISENAQAIHSLFVKSLMQLRFGEKTGIVICYKNKGVLTPIPNQEELQSQILSCYEERYNEDVNGFFKLACLDFKLKNFTGYNVNSKKNGSIIRRFALENLDIILDDPDLERGDKNVIINELLAKVNFLKYKHANRNMDGNVAKVYKSGIADRIAKQFTYAKKRQRNKAN